MYNKNIYICEKDYKMEKYINLENNFDYKKLKKTAEILKNGGIVVFPTETVYGIGVDGLNENAVKKLYKVKKRSENKPISLLVSSIKMVEDVAKDISNLEYALMNKFFPGPLTIILKKKDIIPNVLTANTNTIGIRMPQNEIAINLINFVGKPLATSSANISGEKSGTNIDDIIGKFEEVDYYIDGGESEIGFSSTVVQIIDNKLHILRKGSITEEQIKEVMKENS